MTRKKFDFELVAMQNEMVNMCEMVKSAIKDAVQSLINEDTVLAKEVYSNGGRVDDMETKIEHMCLNLITRQQPIATDLRRISAALKIITDMERIGDQAEDISMLTINMAVHDESMKPPADLLKMANKVIEMVDGAIEAYLDLDVEKANAICAADDQVDEMYRLLVDEMVEHIRQDPASVYRAVNYVLVIKYLERIADHATNIAEWVVFIVTGEHQEGSVNTLQE